jgi:hypothetical protein
MRRLKLIVLFALWVIIPIGCNDKKQTVQPYRELVDLEIEENSVPIIIQLSNSHDHKHEFKLSEIATEVCYIPLETNINCLIGDDFLFPKFSREHIFLEANGILFQFNKQGKYIRKVNKIGQGPGECSVRDFGIDEKNQLIYLFDNWTLSVNIFDYNGNYIRRIKNPFENESNSSPLHMDCDKNGNILFTFGNETGDMKYKYIAMDNEGNILFKSTNYVTYFLNKRISLMSFGLNPIYEYKNNSFYEDIFNDTIFQINDDYSCTPIYIRDLPNKITLEDELKMGARILDSSSFSSKSMYSFVREDERYFYVYHTYNPYSKNNKKFLSRYDKQTNQLMENINPVIKNDWDGGMDITLIPERQNESEICIPLQPFEIKEVLTNLHFDKSEAKYLDKKDALKSLVNRLEDDDNPVLMIIQLK